MRSQALERSEYWFDPTANQAVSQIDRERRPKPRVSYIVERATPSEVAKYQGVVFEPVNLNLEITKARQMILSIQRQREGLIKKHGKRDVQSVPEFQALTSELFKTRNVLENAQAAKRR